MVVCTFLSLSKEISLKGVTIQPMDSEGHHKVFLSLSKEISLKERVVLSF